MQVVDDPSAFRRALDEARAKGARVGLVPTMGALHAGHRSLIAGAVAGGGHVAVSIFVNPLQFDRPEDLASYPRDFDHDLDVCEEAGVTTVFAPSADAMFPSGAATTVSVAGIGDRWEGEARPGHFDGVATVVAKLFALTGPCAAYFGEKDFQQLVLVRRMAADLMLPVEVVGCPTVRDPDGLALSSRNVRLSPEERDAASVLWHALVAGRAAVAGGEDRPDAVVSVMSELVAAEPSARLGYAAAVDTADLTVPALLSGPASLRLLVAAEIGAVRLIDNCDALRPSDPAGNGRARHGHSAAASPAAASSGAAIPATAPAS